MRKAGIREARQNLSALIEEVRSGHEVVITDRGKPVARLVPYTRESATPYLSRSTFRTSMPTLRPPLSETLAELRDDRL